MMYAAGERFLMSVSSPLELTAINHVSSLSMEQLGTAVQKHINLLRSRGFEVKRIQVDPHKSLMGLQGAFPGTVIAGCGVGDHLDKVDGKIRCMKELRRSVLAGLPYKLPKARVKDLATYTISRINNCRTGALMDNDSPSRSWRSTRERGA